MKKQLEQLESAIVHLKEKYPELSKDVLKKLENAYESMLKYSRKRRCKHCDRKEHYDETLGIYKCEQCDKKDKK